MKILRVVPTMDATAGGPIEVIRQFAVAANASGHSVDVVSLDDPGAEFVLSSTIPIHALGRPRNHYCYHPRLKSWLKENAKRYDAVIVDGIWQYHSVAVRRALKDTQTPYVIFPHGMLELGSDHSSLNRIKKALYWRWIENANFEGAAAIVFTCEQEKLDIGRIFPISNPRQQVVYLGIAPPPPVPSDLFLNRFPSLHGKRLALFLGRLHPVKGCDTLLRGFAHLARATDEWRLVMAGPDQVGWEAELRRLAASLGIEQAVVWAGMLAGEQKWSALRAAEVMVAPSHRESFGIVIPEALGCGVPVLISDKVSIGGVIASYRCGFVAPDNDAGVELNFQRWIALSETGRRATVDAARRCFNSRFHISTAASELLQVLCSLKSQRVAAASHA